MGTQLRRSVIPREVAVAVGVVVLVGVSAVWVASARGAHSQDIAPYLTLAGGTFTILGVWWNLSESGRRRDEDHARADRQRLEDAARAETAARQHLERQHESVRARILGSARVVRNRLSIVYQTGGNPLDGYVPFERFLDVAYSGDAAALVNARGVAIGYFEDLSFFEQAFGSMRYSLQRHHDLSHDDYVQRPGTCKRERHQGRARLRRSDR